MFFLVFSILLLVVFPSLSLSTLTHKRIEYYLATLLPAYSIILYLFGIFHGLSLAFWLIVSMDALFLCLFIWKVINDFRKSPGVLLHNLCSYSFTPGLLQFLIGVVWVIFCNIGRVFGRWDEFSHWGRIVKIIYSYNCLPVTNPDVLDFISFKTYPVGTALVQYLFSRLYDPKNFIEMVPIIAHGITYFSLFTLLAEKLSWKDWKISILSFGCLIWIPLAIIGPYYTNLYVDGLLGVTLAFVCYLFFEKSTLSYFHVSLLTVLLAFLILEKASGTGLALFFCVISVGVGCRKFMRQWQHKQPISGCYIYGIPLLSFLIKVIHNLTIRNVSQQFSSKNISFNNILSLLGCQAESLPVVVWHKMIDALFFHRIPRMVFPITYGGLVLLLSITIMLLTMLVRKRERTLYQTAAVLLPCYFIIYAFTLYIYYIFSFSEHDAQNIASFPRYVGTFIIAALLITVFLSVKCYYECKKRCTLIPLWIMFPLLLNGPSARALKGCFSDPISNTSMVQHLVMKQVVEQYIGVSDKLFIINQHNGGHERFVMQTYFPKNFFKTKAEAFGEANQGYLKRYPYSTEELQSIVHNTDYCFLYETDDYLKQHYGSFFDDGAENSCILYQCAGGKLKHLPYKNFTFDFQNMTCLSAINISNTKTIYSTRRHGQLVKLGSFGSVMFELLPFITLSNGRLKSISINCSNLQGKIEFEMYVNDKSSGSFTLEHRTENIQFSFPEEIVHSLKLKFSTGSSMGSLDISRLVLDYADAIYEGK